MRADGETEVDRRGVDEGEGTGFDNLDLSAYAERVFVPAEDWPHVLAWYRARFESLGWRPTRVDTDCVMFRRDDVETAQVQLLPMQDHWSNHYRRNGPFVRVDIRVSPEQDGP